MAARKSLKIAAAVIALLGLALLIYLAVPRFLPSKNPAANKASTQVLQRKLAYTSDPGALMKRAAQAESKGDWKGALDWYKIVIGSMNDTDPRKGYAYYRKAYCSFQLQDYEQAQKSLEYGLNNFPQMSNMDDALFLMAQIYVKQGNFDYAYKTYNTIIKMFPRRADEARKLQSQLPPQPQTATPPQPQNPSPTPGPSGK